MLSVLISLDRTCVTVVGEYGVARCVGGAADVESDAVQLVVLFNGTRHDVDRRLTSLVGCTRRVQLAPPWRSFQQASTYAHSRR